MPSAPNGSSSRAPAGAGPAEVVSRADLERQRRERQQKRLLLEEKARKGVSVLANCDGVFVIISMRLWDEIYTISLK